MDQPEQNNEAEVNTEAQPSENSVPVDSVQDAPKDEAVKGTNLVKITNEKVTKLFGASEGEFVKDVNDNESEIIVNGKVRLINKADFE